MRNSDILNDYVPHISKAEFDGEATRFLKQYCPEALETPMAVPIETIARKKMGLVVLERNLTEDLSILGQMCFTGGLAEIYDKAEDEYREIRVKAGTMIIDPDTEIKRNIGCKRNTISHECFHWDKHRFYHILANAAGKKDTAVAFRCPSEVKDDRMRIGWSGKRQVLLLVFLCRRKRSALLLRGFAMKAKQTPSLPPSSNLRCGGLLNGWQHSTMFQSNLPKSALWSWGIFMFEVALSPMSIFFYRITSLKSGAAL